MLASYEYLAGGQQLLDSMRRLKRAVTKMQPIHSYCRNPGFEILDGAEGPIETKIAQLSPGEIEYSNLVSTLLQEILEREHADAQLIGGKAVE